MIMDETSAGALSNDASAPRRREPEMRWRTREMQGGMKREGRGEVKRQKRDEVRERQCRDDMKY